MSEYLTGETLEWVESVRLFERHPEIEWMCEFVEDAAQVRSNGLWGFIDRNGEWIAEPQFKYVHDFSEGLACVETEASQQEREPVSFLDQFGEDKKTAYIDKTGRIVLELPADVDCAFDFHEGMARAYDRCDRMGFIDTTGHWVIEPQECSFDDFSEGLARVMKKGKCGFIDHDGETVIPMKFDDAESFHDGLARVRIGQRWRYINNEGQFVKKPKNS